MAGNRLTSGESQDTLDLAVALWLANGPRGVRLRHKFLRQLSDRLPQGSELLALHPAQLREWLDDGLEDQANQADQSAAIDFWLTWFSSRQGWSDALDQARTLKSRDIVALTSGHPFYPARLRPIDSAPAILYVCGRQFKKSLEQPFWTTVIGTRNPTLYGQLVTERITTDLARQGAVIVSGLARGIDTIAHETALEQQALTIAVVASGVDIIYPKANQRLADQIREQGAIVSEHPPGTQPLRQYFPARNRILSGLSDAVAVMEAAQKSGTLITATFAADQGREVLAVPGNILDEASGGCHRLIRDGAMLLETAADVLAVLPSVKPSSRQIEFAPAPPCETSQKSEASARPPNYEQVDPFAAKILHCLRQQALHPAQLSSHLNLPIQQIAVQLAALELRQLISEQRGRYALTALGQSSI